MSDPLERDRAVFERWAEAQGFNIHRDDSEKYREYHTATTRWAWLTFLHARNMERQDWNRVHHALAKHGKHPGRTDDHLADVIDRALTAQNDALLDAYADGRADEKEAIVLACIDLVAMHGGSVEIEAAMRRLIDSGSVDAG